MKAKAASKSTNWNLRVMASRSFASSQSGSRLSAVFRSSIANFAMIASQRIVLLDTIDAAVAGQLAGIETERIHAELVAGEKGMRGQPFAHFLQLRMPQPRQGDVGHEFVPILGLPDTADGAIHLALEMVQHLMPPRRRPQGVGLFIAELADAMQLQLEGRRVYRRQGIVESTRVSA